MKIIAIDFETANYSPLSACALGLAIFEDQELISSPYWLIKPPKGYGWFKDEWTQDIHGIGWFDVQDAPDFGQIAPEVIDHLSSADFVVAHNASFDLRVLHALLTHFKFPIPTLKHRCTLELARQTWPHLPNHQLSTLADHLGIDLNHHHAQSDAIAAGRVMVEISKSTDQPEESGYLS
ncbi:MAG: 3'-5' exonuclease [Verrucomicrobiaceae bacterium]